MNEKTPLWVWVLILGIPMLASLPVLAGYISSAPPERLFMGFDFIDDFHYYGNYIYSYAQEPFDLFIPNRATSEPQDGRFFFPYFWITGIISWVVGIPLALALIRILTGIILLFLVWKILDYFFTEPFWKKTAFLLACLGAGFGWILEAISPLFPALGNLYSTDLTYSLGYSLFGYLSFPLAIAGEALFLAGLFFLFNYWEKKEIKYVGYFALTLLGMFFVHPVSAFSFFPVFLVGSFLFILQNPTRPEFTKLRWPGISFVCVLVIIGIYLLWALQDMVFQSVFFSYGLWQRSESPFWWFLGYGLILLFALLGVRTIQIENKYARPFFWAWLLVILLLSLNPWKGLRFQHALFLPLVILATFGIRYFWEWIKQSPFHHWIKSPRTIVGFILVLMIPGVLFTLANHIKDVQDPTFHSGPYLSQDEVDALAFLSNQKKGIVLSHYKLGNNLIWMTPHYAYLGHWNQTIERVEKEKKIEEFFAGNGSVGETNPFLQEEKIDYIIMEANDKGFSNSTSLVSQLYSNKTIRVFKVENP